VVREAVKRGVRAGVMGVKIDDEVFTGKDLGGKELPSYAVVLKKEAAQALIAEKSKEVEVGPLGKSHVETIFVSESSVSYDRVQTEEQRKVAEKEECVIRRVRLRAEVPWDKLSSVISGVILPLNSEAESIKITLEIESFSSSGFDANTLEIKVKETLQQIGADIKEWVEE